MSTPQQHHLEHPAARYFRAGFPVESALDPTYGPGVWYVEFVEGIARRQFEVYAGHVRVAPYDMGFADQYDVVLADEHYAEILLATFEYEWQQHASRRLREIAGLVPNS